MNVNNNPSPGAKLIASPSISILKIETPTEPNTVPATSSATDTLSRLSASGASVYGPPQTWVPGDALAPSLKLKRAMNVAQRLAWWLMQLDAGSKLGTLRGLIERAEPAAQSLQLSPDVIQALPPLLQQDTFVRMTSRMREGAPKCEFVLWSRPDGAFHDLIPISHHRPPLTDTSDAAIAERVLDAVIGSARGTGNQFLRYPTPSLAVVGETVGATDAQARHFHRNPYTVPERIRQAMPKALEDHSYEENYTQRQNVALIVQREKHPEYKPSISSGTQPPGSTAMQQLAPLADANGHATDAAMALLAELAQTPGYFNTPAGDMIAGLVHRGTAAWFDVHVRVDSVTPTGEQYQVDFPASSPERPAIRLKCEDSHYNFRRGDEWVDVPADGDCQFRALYEALQDTGDAQILASLPADPLAAVTLLRQATGNYLRQESDALRVLVDPEALDLEAEREKRQGDPEPRSKRLKQSAAGSP